jgi:DNA excision repair protein ERCC-6
VQVAAFLGAAAASRRLKSVLVVAPATMLQHWLRELATWAPGLRRILIHSSNNNGGPDGDNNKNRHPEALTASMLRQLSQWLKSVRADRVNEMIDDDDLTKLPSHSFCGTGFVIVTTYENLRRHGDVYTQHNWSYLVLDEAQKIRNPDAAVTMACKQIPTPHRLAMSGTPIQNDLRELWSLFDFVFPGRLGTLPTFEQEFAEPIKRGGYTNASPMQVQLAYRCALMLRDLIEPFLLRRLKRDVKEVQKMPGKTEQVLFCRLSKLQRDMYEAYLQSDEIKQVMRGSTQLLKATVVLRKIANHPDLVCEPDQAASFVQTRGSSCNARLERNEDDDYDDDEDDEDLLQDEESLVQRSGKLEVLSKILPLWHKQGHRVLIFCQWKKMLNIIQRFTMLKGWKFGRLDGDTNVGSRQRLVDTFNTDLSYMGLLCTTRTGGVGLNLTGANRIILYDPDWNPSSEFCLFVETLKFLTWFLFFRQVMLRLANERGDSVRNGK